MSDGIEQTLPPSRKERVIDRLLAPLSQREFFERHWDRSAVHIRGPKDKLEAFYSLESWKQCRAFTQVKASLPDASGVDRERELLPLEVHAAFAAGEMICGDVSADPSLGPLLAALKTELQLPGWPAFAKLYASKDERGFQLHFDPFHVFVLQIAGRKRWRFSKTPGVAWPLSGSAGLLKPGEAGLEEVVLEPGHVLYLPPGTWHRAYAIGESIAVSVSPPRSTALELVLRWLQDELSKVPEWRSDVYPGFSERAKAGAVHASVEARLAERLADLKARLTALDVRGLHRLWRLNVGSEGAPVASALLQPDDALAHARPFEFLAAPLPETGEEALFLYASGAELALPAAARKFLAALEARPRFVAREALQWDSTLDWEQVADVLGQLLEAGLLVRGAHPRP